MDCGCAPVKTTLLLPSAVQMNRCGRKPNLYLNTLWNGWFFFDTSAGSFTQWNQLRSNMVFSLFNLRLNSACSEPLHAWHSRKTSSGRLSSPATFANAFSGFQANDALATIV